MVSFIKLHARIGADIDLEASPYEPLTFDEWLILAISPVELIDGRSDINALTECHCRVCGKRLLFDSDASYECLGLSHDEKHDIDGNPSCLRCGGNEVMTVISNCGNMKIMHCRTLWKRIREGNEFSERERIGIVNWATFTLERSYSEYVIKTIGLFICYLYLWSRATEKGDVAGLSNLRRSVFPRFKTRLRRVKQQSSSSESERTGESGEDGSVEPEYDHTNGQDGET